MQGIKVLSLFDGMGCGYQALKEAGIAVAEYHAFEIDKYAIQIAKKNHPDIRHHGSVIGANFGWFYGFDLVIAGSPCQGFSFAGKQLAFDDPRSVLFFEFVRAIKEVNPWFYMLENVKMKQIHLDVITDALNVRPILLNSDLVSAQSRQRYYWCNWLFNLPVDKKIMLKDIIVNGYVDRDKSYCIDANYFKGGNLNQYFNKSRRQIVFNYSSSGRGNGVVENRHYEAEKSLTLTRTGYTRRGFTGVIENDAIRKLLPIECERLQTLPDGYTEGVSDTQRYKMLGNGWTCSMIAHIFRGLPYATS